MNRPMNRPLGFTDSEIEQLLAIAGKLSPKQRHAFLEWIAAVASCEHCEEHEAAGRALALAQRVMAAAA